MTLSHRLSYSLPYAAEPILRTLAAHALPGMERPDPGAHTRTVKGPLGPALVTVSFGIPGEVAVEAVLPDADDGAWLAPLLRRWLDLDADPAGVDAFLSGHGLLAPLVRARPGLRVLGTVDGFETAVMAVVGQQVSLAAARTFGGRLVAGYGTPAPHGFLAFPAAAALAAAAPEELRAAVGITGARSRTLAGLSAAVAGGGLILDHTAGRALDPAAGRAALLELPGIGPWTADYLAVRVFADRDAYPSGDLILRRALGVANARDAAALSEPWRPYRAYAVTHLWTGDSFT